MQLFEVVYPKPYVFADKRFRLLARKKEERCAEATVILEFLDPLP